MRPMQLESTSAVEISRREMVGDNRLRTLR